MQPVDGTFGHIFGHALHFVVEGPAVPAVEVALVVDKQIRGNGMEFTGHHSRVHIGQQPAADFPPYLWIRPVTLVERGFRAGIVQQFRMLGENGFGQRRTLGLGRGWSTGTGVH